MNERLRVEGRGEERKGRKGRKGRKESKQTEMWTEEEEG